MPARNRSKRNEKNRRQDENSSTTSETLCVHPNVPSPQTDSSSRVQSLPSVPYSNAFEPRYLSHEHVATDTCDGVDVHGLFASPGAVPATISTSLACKESQMHLNNEASGSQDLRHNSERDLMEAELLLAEDELRVRKRRIEYERLVRSARSCEPKLESEDKQKLAFPLTVPLNTFTPKNSVESERSVNSRDNVVHSLEASLKSLSLGMGLPKIEVEVFDGTPSRFWSYVRTFQTAVVDKLNDEGQKLSYLLYYCQGCAKEAIEYCVFLPTEDGFSEAMCTLTSQFGRTHDIVQAITKDIFDGPKLHHNETEGLRPLAIRMKGCEITLYQMNRTAELNCSVNLLRLVGRLPRNLQERRVDIGEKIIESCREPSFNDLLCLVDKQLSRSTSVYGQLVASSTRNDESRLNPRRVMSCNATAKPLCPLCNVRHELAQCDNFRNSSVTERRRIVLSNKRCFLCLKANHTVEFGRAMTVCGEPKCGRRHHSLLHTEWVHQESNQPVDCGATSAKSKGVRLGYVPVRLVGPLGTVET